MTDQIPRLSADEISPALATFLRPKVERLGYLGEFFQQERLSYKPGASDATTIEALRLASDNHQVLSAEEQVMQQLAISVARRGGRNSFPEIKTVTRAIGLTQAIAVLMLIGQYISRALTVHTLNLDPPLISVLQEIRQ